VAEGRVMPSSRDGGSAVSARGCYCCACPSADRALIDSYPEGGRV